MVTVSLFTTVARYPTPPADPLPCSTACAPVSRELLAQHVAKDLVRWDFHHGVEPAGDGDHEEEGALAPIAAQLAVADDVAGAAEDAVDDEGGEPSPAGSSRMTGSMLRARGLLGRLTSRRSRL